MCRMKAVMTAVRMHRMKVARGGGQDISVVSFLVCISAGSIRVFRSEGFLMFCLLLIIIIRQHGRFYRIRTYYISASKM